MSYSLGAAARVTGRSKSTILRAVRASKISATRDEASGGWRIDAAELFRVYPYPTVAEPVDETGDGAISNGSGTEAPGEIRELRARLEGAEARLADARDRLADAQDQIADLRKERDRLLSLHEADQQMLADLREKPQPRRRWWRWGTF